jgi:peptidoglycan hydrolase-like protein with peptidoglycan-binding domain
MKRLFTVTWTTTIAIALVSVMLASPAFAQATTGSPETKGEKPKGAPAKPDGAGQTPKASDSGTSGTMKSDSSTMTSDTGTKSGRKGGMAMDAEKVKAAQQALKDKGHDPGDIDGKMGPKTQAALRDFQKAQGMQATGRLDPKTMQSLGMEGAKTSSAERPTTGSASPATGSGSAMPKSDTSTSGGSAQPKGSAKQ